MSNRLGDGSGESHSVAVPESEARRDFLKKAGKFAAVTPPSITLLLGTSLSSKAIAKSGGGRPGYGWGDKKVHHSGPPGRKWGKKKSHHSSSKGKNKNGKP